MGIRGRRFIIGAAVASMVVIMPSIASAQATLVTGLGGAAGFGTNSLPAADDGSSAAIDITAAFPTGITFAGSRYTTLYVNMNGNVSFGAPNLNFVPSALPIGSVPMIDPWWGDVDTSVSPVGPSGVFWSVTNEVVVTWYNVGYFKQRTNHLNAFQMILVHPAACPPSAPDDYDIEFRYHRCEWTTGDASGGTDGGGGTPAQAGYDLGVDAGRAYVLPGSRTANIVNLCTTSNTGETGVWRTHAFNGALPCNAGSCPDGGSDAGSVNPCLPPSDAGPSDDGGAVDASVRADGGGDEADAASSPADASATDDASDEPASGSSGGCGCNVETTPLPVGGWLALGAVGALFGRRRRRAGR